MKDQGFHINSLEEVRRSRCHAHLLTSFSMTGTGNLQDAVRGRSSHLHIMLILERFQAGIMAKLWSWY